MRHLKAHRKLNRTSSHRSLMLRNLVTSLFEHERVETTVMKAKEARRIAERMITLGKRGTLHARRQAASVLMKKSVLKKLFDEIAPKYAKREGGYTRILRVGYRKGDGAPLAFLELVEGEVTKKKRTEKKAPPKTNTKGTQKKIQEKVSKKKGEAKEKTASNEKPVETSQKESKEPETMESPVKEAEGSEEDKPGGEKAVDQKEAEKK